MFNKIKGQLKEFFDARIHHEILEEFSLFEQKYLDEKKSLFQPTIIGLWPQKQYPQHYEVQTISFILYSNSC